MIMTVILQIYDEKNLVIAIRQSKSCGQKVQKRYDKVYIIGAVNLLLKHVYYYFHVFSSV